MANRMWHPRNVFWTSGNTHRSNSKSQSNSQWIVQSLFHFIWVMCHYKLSVNICGWNPFILIGWKCRPILGYHIFVVVVFWFIFDLVESFYRFGKLQMIFKRFNETWQICEWFCQSINIVCTLYKSAEFNKQIWNSSACI